MGLPYMLTTKPPLAVLKAVRHGSPMGDGSLGGLVRASEPLVNRSRTPSAIGQPYGLGLFVLTCNKQ